MEVLLWPAQSPDINPIEHLCNHVKRKLAEYDVPPLENFGTLGESTREMG